MSANIQIEDVNAQTIGKYSIEKCVPFWQHGAIYIVHVTTSVNPYKSLINVLCSKMRDDVIKYCQIMKINISPSCKPGSLCFLTAIYNIFSINSEIITFCSSFYLYHHTKKVFEKRVFCLTNKENVSITKNDIQYFSENR